MKKIILFSTIFGLNLQIAHASQKKLVCSSGNSFETFSATLDNQNYGQEGKYFDVKDGSFVDGYVTAKLLCTGHELGNITCLGFLFGNGNYITKLSVRNIDGVLSATSKQLEGRQIYNYNTTPWPCTIK